VCAVISVNGSTAVTKIQETDVRLTIGIDTHAEVHVAVALDQMGRRLTTCSIPTTTTGHTALMSWANELGTIERIGMEGTGSYGAGLGRWLRAQGLSVLEVERPKRQTRRRRGKSDPLDAEAAARAVQLAPPWGSPRPGRATSR